MCTKKILLTLTGIMLLFLTQAEDAWAFQYGGEAWCCDTVYYYVNPTNPSSSCGGIVIGPWFQGLINGAATTWNYEGTAFRLQFAGTTSVSCFAQSNVCKGIKDGQNTISMDGGCSWYDDNVIAYATWWFWTGGDSAYCIYESDICFNDDVTWYNNAEIISGNCYDLLSVALHELGHWISGDHENDYTVLGYKPIMYYSFNYREMRRNVTPDDSALLRWAYDECGNISWPYRDDVVHYHPPYPSAPPHDSCWPPPEYPPDCDLSIYDSCLLICPASDVVWPVIVRDIRGEPVCDMDGTWLNFTECATVECPDEEPDWPIVRPDSCNPGTGTHYFTIDAGLTSCEICEADLYINAAYCGTIYARFFDNNGDLSVTRDDYVHGRICEDYNCNFASDGQDSLIWKAHLNHSCAGECDCDPGNCNGDQTINMLDILYLISYLYKSGPAPTPYQLCSGDPDCSCTTDMLDILHLIAYLYKGGPTPCTCEEWLSACGPPLR